MNISEILELNERARASQGLDNFSARYNRRWEGTSSALSARGE
jgi:hypothetical protein